jgi:hypothetical protein
MQTTNGCRQEQAGCEKEARTVRDGTEVVHESSLARAPTKGKTSLGIIASTEKKWLGCSPVGGARLSLEP